MNEIQEIIAKLKKKKWTLAAIGDEIGATQRTVARWEEGVFVPKRLKSTLVHFESLLEQEPPLRRRYKYNEKSDN
tara:strand:- start:3040 stop:3264 length:225 start_codon:yes stop_codon:yes gene_type:complete